MKLSDYINQWPRRERMDVRRRIAAGSAVKEVAIRHYANGTRQVPSGRVIPVARTTGYIVRPFDLRPDLYPNESDGIPPGALVRQPVIGSDQRGQVVAGLGEVSLQAGGGQPVGQHGVEMGDKLPHSAGRGKRKRIEQQQDADLQRAGGVAQQGGAKRKAGLLGHVAVPAVVGA